MFIVEEGTRDDGRTESSWSSETSVQYTSAWDAMVCTPQWSSV